MNVTESVLHLITVNLCNTCNMYSSTICPCCEDSPWVSEDTQMSSSRMTFQRAEDFVCLKALLFCEEQNKISLRIFVDDLYVNKLLWRGVKISCVYLQYEWQLCSLQHLEFKLIFLSMLSAISVHQVLNAHLFHAIYYEHISF